MWQVLYSILLSPVALCYLSLSTVERYSSKYTMQLSLSLTLKIFSVFSDCPRACSATAGQVSERGNNNCWRDSLYCVCVQVASLDGVLELKGEHFWTIAFGSYVSKFPNSDVIPISAHSLGWVSTCEGQERCQ